MHKLITLVLLLTAGTHALAAEQPSADILAGCAACHGAAGEGSQALGAPPLAGQDVAYLTRQLENFQAGRRGYAEQDSPGQSMRAQAAALDPAQIASLAQHYADLPPVALAAAGGPLDPLGAARYQDTCAVCHGEQAQGYPQMQAPNLRMLGGWYLDRQLASYVQGWRGAEGHADIQGLWMRSIATQISSAAEQRAVVGHIEALGAAR